MRRVERQIEKERLVFVLLNKADALPEPDIRAIAFEPLELPVPLVGIVEVVVAPVVRSLTDAAATMPDDILKAPVLRSVRGIVAEVPLTNHAGGVPVRAKEIRHRLFVPMHHRAPRTGSVGSGVSRVVARHQRRTRRRAERADVEISKANRFSI